MSYVPYYTANFTNEQSQDVQVTIYKKNGTPGTVTENMEVVSLETTDNGEDQTKYNWIFIRELSLTVNLSEANTVTWETFITAEHDEWKIIVLIDTQPYFHGFITPDEGNAPFQDKPYDLSITATNGLALLKEQPLSDKDGANFNNDNTLISYLAGALKKTLLDLPIRIYCGYFNVSMLNKGDGLEIDMFQQTYLNYRTFLKDPVTFVSCYDALKIILNKFCSLEYWNGIWLIKNEAEKQYLPGDNFYVDYDLNGENPVGHKDDGNYSQVGSNLDLYPINENQFFSSRFAIKKATTSYTYNIWPEIPKNNKFDRGAINIPIFGSVFEIDDNGDDTAVNIGTYQGYDVSDWTYGGFNAGPTAITNLPSLASSSPDSMFKKVSSDAFGIEFNRELVLNKSNTTTKVLQSEGIPVRQGDKISIGVDFKLSFNFSGSFPLRIGVVNIYIKSKNSSDTWWWRDGAGISNTWRINAGSAESLFLEYDSSDDHTKLYKNLNIESKPIPVDGTLYIQLVNAMDDGTPNAAYFRNFDFQYKPFIAGGYREVKGDKWTTSQNSSYPDVVDEEVSISDSPIRVAKGALIFKNMSVDVLTSPTWYRINTAASPNPTLEGKHFKELLNIARFNHGYRRMYYLEGEFNGLNDAPENDQLNKTPVGFFKRYREQDLTPPRDFILVAPLKMDLVKGWITANLVEVRKEADGNTDGTRPGDSSSFNFIF